jgi:hypothetical protein
MRSVKEKTLSIDIKFKFLQEKDTNESFSMKHNSVVVRLSVINILLDFIHSVCSLIHVMYS